MKRRHVLITGGSRSGKSRHALNLAEPAARRCFIATAGAFDDEMKARIAVHRDDRGEGWHTIEEQFALANRMEERNGIDEVIVVDCLTLWVSNWLLQFARPNTKRAEATFWDEVGRVTEALRNARGSVILVTNEVGMGVVPETPLGRKFRDLAGSVNQHIAGCVDRVTFMVSGIPWTIKDTLP